MSSIPSNQDLYRAIIHLVESQQGDARRLEEYLLALWKETLSYRERNSLSADEFLKLLSTSFTSTAPPFQTKWLSFERQEASTKQAGFAEWEQCLLRQIIDLHEMEELGMLKNELRSFGIESPRGNSWYNFDPCAYLECATAGQFEDRCNSEATSSIITPVTWDEFAGFLDCGRIYE